MTRPGRATGGTGGVGTLAGMLERRARETPERLAYTFLDDGEREARTLTWGELDRLAAGVAESLREAGLAGERALLLFPPGLDFVVAFLGCLRAGTVAVPAYPPTSRRTLPRLASILDDARPAAALTDSGSLEKLLRSADALPALGGLRWIATDRCGEADAGSAPSPAGALPAPDDLAFLQYTSGSTAEPKGVMVSHGNLVANEAMIARAFGQDESSVVVGWLPVYHDMGLIGNVLQPLYSASRCVLMSPMAFLSRPARWLEAITRYRGTTSGGPDFAYALCVRKIPPEEREGLDLSSWRLAFDGAEPVRAETLERFARAFEPHGFDRRAFFPCYGLAEATLFVSGGPPGSGAEVAEVSAPALERDRVEAPEDSAGRLLVASGPPPDELRVEIVDPGTGRAARPGSVGEVWVAGPSVARGYWNRPERTASDFGAALAEEPRGDAFLRTGDLGFVRDGRLFVTGRLKDLVILRGRNHYPQDIEHTVEAAHPDVRPGSTAAFSVEAGGEERLVVVCELPRHPSAEPEEIVGAVHQAVAEGHEVAAHDVVLLRPGGVPRTTSGKLRRRACRDAYLADELPVIARGGRTAAAPAAAEPSAVPAATLLEVVRLAALALELPPEVALRLDPATPLTRLGLDSLAAVELERRLRERFGRGVGLASLLEGASVEEIARTVTDGPGPAAGEGAPEPVSEGADLPLSHEQEALWFLTRLVPESGAYNLGGAARIRGGLDIGALGRAVARLAERHPALRATFHGGADGPRQRIRPAGSPAPAPFERIDLRQPRNPQDRDDGGGDLAAPAEEILRRPFDLEAGPPFRVTLLRRPEGDAVVLAVHHLVSDFWSLALLVEDLGALYRREAEGGGAEDGALRAEPAVGYGALIAARRRWAESEGAEASWRFWRRALGEDPDGGLGAGLDRLADRSRPVSPRFRGGTVSRALPGACESGLRALVSDEGASVFTGLLAGFGVLLHRLTGAERFVVGAPTATRSRSGSDRVVGYLVNPLPVPADLSGRPGFREVVARARAALAGALEHQDLPLKLLEERLGVAGEAGMSRLLRVTAVHHRAPRPSLRPLAALAAGRAEGIFDLGGLEAEPVALPESASQFDLTLRSAETAGGLVLSLQYDADLFERDTAERLLASLERLLAAAVADPDRPVAELPLLAPGERRRLLAEWGAAPRELPGGLLHELLLDRAEGAERTPDAVAVNLGADQLSYGELARRVRALAARLRASGVGADRRVALAMEPGLERLVALFGVLAAGGAYVPLDPEQPDARLAGMIEDARPLLVLADAATRGRLPAGPPVHSLSDELPEPPPGSPPVGADPSSAAYVLFTSGSTGRPKGVVVPHRAIVNHMRWMQRVHPLAAGDCVLQRTSIGFDASVWELQAAFAAGGRLALAKAGLSREPARLADTVRRERATVLQLVPSLLDALVREPSFAGCRSLARIFCGGEALPEVLARRVLEELPVGLVNLYGPTETTVECASRAWPAGSAPDTVTLGGPIDNARLAVVDARLEPLPVGAPGELVVGGECVSRGYAGRPAWTAERFVPDPFSGRPGDRLYRSGDLVRWSRSGELELMGRIDRQVKLRGHRIEPGEIEAALAGHPDVARAVVDLWPPGSGNPRLAAWVVPEAGGPAPPPAALREHLAGRLPELMIPRLYRSLDALPLTPNGKIDRRALPAPEPGAGAGGRPPDGPVEERVAGAFRELLEPPGPVTADDSFFDLGGHSLLATRLVARLRESLGVEVPVRTVFERPTVSALAAWIESGGDRTGRDGRPEPIPRLPRDRPLPASFAQSRLWFLDRFDPGAGAYTMAGALRLEGDLDRPALARAVRGLAVRHEVLRTLFREVGGEPVQRVLPPAAAGAGGLPVVDLGGLPEGARAREVRRLGGRWARRPFDLARRPPLRALLVALRPREHAALFALHHAAADGWSLGVLYRDLAVLYAAGVEGRRPELPELPIQYADFAAWQRERLRGAALDEDLAYWRRRLGDEPPVLDLPADRPRPARPSFRGGWRPVRLPAGELRALARREGVTLFMLLLAGFQALLHRWTGEDDVAVGSPIAGRRRRELEGLVGFFVNTLVLRTDLSGEPRFRDLLGRVREVCLGAYEHQDLPFERLVEALQPERAPSHNPLFQVTFALHNAPAVPPAMVGLAVTEERLDTGRVKFDLDLGLEEPSTDGGGDALAGRLEYAADLFDATTVERFWRQLVTLLAGAAADPGRPVAALDLLGAAERHQVAREWNDTAPPAGAPEDAGRVEELVLRAAGVRPEASAVADPVRGLTYGELERESRALALRLRSLGAAPETVVGVLCHPSVDFVVAVLAALRAGAAYLPLDPAHPEERLAYLLEDSAAPVLVTHRDLAPPGGFGGAEARLEDERAAGEPGPPPEVSGAGPDALAYVIYTSGSTGKPKGVAVSHRALLNLVGWHRRAFALSPGDRASQLAGLGFDAAVWEIWPYLAAGASIRIPGPEFRSSPEALVDWVSEEGVTIGFFATPLAEAVLALDWPPDTPLRTLLTGGDALRSRPASGAPFALVNDYGPTENAVVATSGRVVPEGSAPPAIGRPIGGVEARVTDRALRPVPPGVPGELCLTGRSLARGYPGRPRATAERFVPSPWGGRGERAYRTGDLVRWRPDGALEFSGRIDRQVKVRGFRIELGEVEIRLRALGAVADATVVRVGDAGHERLVAYVVPATGAAVDRRALAACLVAELPEPMVPSVFVELDALPLTPNGKIDREALPEPPAAGERDGRGGRRGPRTPTEELVAGVWAEVLALDAVGPEDDFFELGGHSLLATRMVSRLRDVLGLDVPLREAFERPSVAGLAAWLDERRRGGALPAAAPPIEASPIETAEDPARSEAALSYGQERLWFLQQLEPESAAYNVAVALRLRGALDHGALRRALGEVVRRHAVLRTRFPSADDRPVPVVAPPPLEAGPELPSVDLSDAAGDAREAAWRRRAARAARRPFRLDAESPLRPLLLRLSDDEHVLALTLHHIATDGWSMALLLRELGALYGAFAAGDGSPLAEPEVQYADYARWQRRWLSGEVLALEIGHWRERLAGAPPLLPLPTDRPRPRVRSDRGAGLAAELDPALADGVRVLAAEAGATPFMVLFTAFAALLSRISGETDVVVGTPIAGRTRAEVEDLVGFFVNTLALRVDLSDDPPFRTALARVREATLDAFAHQEVPFERLVEELRPERNLGHSPLFQVMFSYQDTPWSGAGASPGPPFGDLEATPEEIDEGTAQFDLTLAVRHEDGRLRCRLIYGADLFERATAERWLDAFRRLLAGAMETPDRPLGRLPLVAPGDRETLLEAWAPGRLPEPDSEPVALPSFFERRAAETPDALALVGPDPGTGRIRHLSYGELERRSGRLAGALRAAGAGPEVTVGVLLPRSPELVVALLGVLRAGSAYVPLDPSYPPERIAFMLRDSGAPLLVARGGTRPEVEGVRTVPPNVAAAGAGELRAPDARRSAEHLAEHLAYVIYTSGSTGRPKGVAIEHRSAVELVRWARRRFGDDELAGVLAATSVCFDLSVFELFAPLSWGGSVLLAEDALSLVRHRGASRVRLVNTVPSAMAELARGELPSGVTTVNLAGEPLSPDLARRVHERPGVSRLFNLYGPSEDTTYSTEAPVGPDGEVTIGRPVDGGRALVLDRGGALSPVGSYGELCLGGRGLARGYLGRPALTAERFVPDPHAPDTHDEAPGARIYRTGDLARWRPAEGKAGAVLEYAGRIDPQVKVRGFRIELEEVEAALARHPAVAEAAVAVAGEGSDRFLAGYLVPAGEEVPAGAELRAFLRSTLPEHMVPTAWVALAELPRTPNGKLDRRALPRPGASAAGRPEHVAPRSELEELLVAIWSEVLGRDDVGVHDDFFDLGGQSLRATQVVAKLRTALEVEVPVRALFEAPTVAGLAVEVVRALAAEAGEEDLEALVGDWAGEPESAERLPAEPVPG